MKHFYIKVDNLKITRFGILWKIGIERGSAFQKVKEASLFMGDFTGMQSMHVIV